MIGFKERWGLRIACAIAWALLSKSDNAGISNAVMQLSDALKERKDLEPCALCNLEEWNRRVLGSRLAGEKKEGTQYGIG